MNEQHKQELAMLRDAARDAGIELPPPPETDSAAVWGVYVDECRWAVNGGEA